jgi:cytochrome c553
MMKKARAAVFVVTTSSLLLVGIAAAQAPAPKPPTKAPAAASGPKVYGNLAQVMRGILFPASNVIFAAQNEDPSKVPPAKDPALATDPLANSYGGWQAVENAAIALSESANLLIIPGRKCLNGRAVPINNPDWAKFVQGLRDAGDKAYKAAQAKDMDKILDAADTMTTACSNCHDKYREKTPRCQ